MNGKQFAPLRPAILAAAQAVEPTAHSPRLGGTKSDGRPCVSIQHDNRDQKTAKRVLTAAVRSVIGPAIVYVVGPMTCSGLQPVRPAGGCYILDSMTREGDDVTMTFRRDPGPDANPTGRNRQPAGRQDDEALVCCHGHCPV